MPHIELRLQKGTKSAGDLIVSVQDKTFDYLMSSISPEIRISGYLDQDYDRVEARYEEVFVSDNCPYVTTINQIIPGSRTRKNITLPDAMEEGEQLVILTTRTPAAK